MHHPTHALFLLLFWRLFGVIVFRVSLLRTSNSSKQNKSSFLMNAVLLLSAFISASHPNCLRYAFPSTSTGSGAVSCSCSVLCSILPIFGLCCAVFACARSFVQILFAFCGHLRFAKRAICFSLCRTKVVCLHKTIL